MADRDPTFLTSCQPEKILALMANLYPTLTPREGACIFWTCIGLTKKEIAVRLDISESTVKFHIKSVFKKQEFSSMRDVKTSFFTNIILLHSLR